jgi:uncharacterized membrane protein
MDVLATLVLGTLACTLLLASWAVWLWRYAAQEHRARRLGMLVLASLAIGLNLWAVRDGRPFSQHALGTTLGLLVLPLAAALQVWPLLFTSRRREW